MASQVNLLMSLDLSPAAASQGLALNFDTFQAQFNVTNTVGNTLAIASAGAHVLPFGLITAAQVLFVSASAPVELTLTYATLGSVELSGTVFLITGPDSTNALSAATVTSLTASTSVTFVVGG